jgi:hypothetical protein
MGLESSSIRTIDINLEEIKQIREKMPIVQHRRRDLYTLTSSINQIGILYKNNFVKKILIIL